MLAERAAAGAAPPRLRRRPARPSSRQAPPREVAGERERDRDCGVEMGAGDVAGRVDHAMITRPNERDPDAAERALALRVDHDRAAAGEDQRERADRLGDAAAGERGSSLGRSSPIRPARARRSRLGSAHRLERLAGRVIELPVLVALAGIDRAGVAAAHRDHDIGGTHGFVGQRLWVLLAPCRCRARRAPRRVRVDLLGRRGPAERTRMRPPSAA